MPVSLLSRNIAPIVSMFDLKSMKWMYLLRDAGFIFRIFLFSFNFILLPSRVFDYIFVSFYRTKAWILPRYYFAMAGISQIVYSHCVTFQPESNLLQSQDMAYAVYLLKILTISYFRSYDISYEIGDQTTFETGFTFGLGFYFTWMTLPSSDIQFTMKSVNMNLVTAGIGSPLLMYSLMPTSAYYFDCKSCLSLFSSQDYIVVLYILYQYKIIVIIIFDMPKPSLKLQINLTEPPSLPSSQPHKNKTISKHQKLSRQLQIRQKHQIEQMQNQVRKLTQKIESQRNLLKNRIICQQLQHQLKKNQIASKMSKKEIILKRLELMKKRDKESSGGMKVEGKIRDKEEKDKMEFSSSREKNGSSLPKVQSGKLHPRRLSAVDSIRMQYLKTLNQKQKQYGNRVQKQFHHNRAKSALSYLQIQRLSQLRKSQQQQDRNRILQQLKKPQIPIKISQKDRHKQIERICRSAQSVESKLKILNYMSEIQLNKIKLKQIKGKEQNHMDILNHINRARTQIMLKNY